MRVAKAFFAVFVTATIVTAILSLLVYAIAMSIATLGAAFGPFGVLCFVVIGCGFVAGMVAAAEEIKK